MMADISFETTDTKGNGMAFFWDKEVFGDKIALTGAEFYVLSRSR